MHAPLRQLLTKLIGPAAAVAAVVSLSACGSATQPASHSTALQSGAVRTQAFSWLRPEQAPRAWHSATLPSGAAQFAYPADWRLIRTDPGTVTAALRDGDGEIAGYLNATPQQASESLDNWSSFRPDHNGDEGDVDLRPIAAATDLAFRSGRGSCLIEDYRTSSDHPYREIACIVHGSRATTVIVGAAPPDQWDRRGPAIERAISSFLT